MKPSTELIPDTVFYAFHATMEKDYAVYVEHTMLTFQISGEFTMQTSSEEISMRPNEILLLRKYQVGEVTKKPLDSKGYQTVVVFLRDELLRQIALEEQIEIEEKYMGKSNILIPPNDFLQAYFQSVMPYIRNPIGNMERIMGSLKVKEAVKLLLQTQPGLINYLFDFSVPYKIDLEKFMLSNFYFNVPVEKFAQLTGRSLASFKRDFKNTFGASPRQWLQEKRLTEARHLIEKKKKKPSTIYLELGFESLAHFSRSFKEKFGKAPSDYF